jgi:phage-related holin
MSKKTIPALIVTIVLLVTIASGCIEDPTPTPPVSPIATPGAGVAESATPPGLEDLELPPFLDDIMDFFKWLVSIPEVKLIGGHIVLNTIVAIAAALYTSSFQFNKLWEFLYRKLLPYCLIYGAARLLGEATGTSELAAVVFAIIEAMLIADLAENLGKMGIKWPTALRRMITK